MKRVMAVNSANLGEYLKTLRGKRSTRQIENATGVSKSYINLIEKGNRHPSPEILKKLSGCYGVTYEHLLEAAGYLTSINKIEEEVNPDLRILAKAQRNMTPEQIKQLRAIAESIFMDAFKDIEE
jgi:transcriptional regulator with XRE-family HTH domain